MWMGSIGGINWEVFILKPKFPGVRMSYEKSDGITEQATPGMGMGIHKEEPYNKYGDDAREIEIESLEMHDTFIRVESSKIPCW